MVTCWNRCKIVTFINFRPLIASQVHMCTSASYFNKQCSFKHFGVTTATPPLFDAPAWELRISGWNLPRKYYRDGTTVYWKFHNPNFNRFSMIHPCDGQMDRQTGDSIYIIHAIYSIYALARKILYQRAQEIQSDLFRVEKTKLQIFYSKSGVIASSTVIGSILPRLSQWVRKIHTLHTISHTGRQVGPIQDDKDCLLSHTAVITTQQACHLGMRCTGVISRAFNLSPFITDNSSCRLLNEANSGNFCS